jgi:O-antigen ligase
MSQTTQISTASSVGHVDTAELSIRASQLLGSVVFFSLLGLFVVVAIPYGTAEAWWKAFFVCVIFSLAILWIVESYLRGSWIGDAWPLVLPILTLALFSLFQTLPFGQPHQRPGRITLAPWYAVSDDPYQTRFFTAQLLALMLAGVFLFRYASTERRVRILINVVLGVAVASALFGVLRQTMQHDIGFGLPLIAPNQGYGQFVNNNHFAYLMEMGFGLALGMIVGGVKREQMLLYVSALLPLWTALVLCGSRGGLIAMMAQVIVAAFFFGGVVRIRNSLRSHSRVIRLAASLPVRAALLVILILGVFIGTLWLGGEPLAKRIEESRNELGSEANEARAGASRNEIWRATMRMFAASPIVGVGMGGYWAAIPAFHDASGRVTPQEAHSDYLELLASGGLIGLAIGVWFAVVVFRRTRENLRSPNYFRRAICFGALIGMTGVAVHSLVDFGLHMIVNALAFTTLVFLATSKTQWTSRATEEV